MAARSWRWLRTRIVGLFCADTRVARHFYAASKQPTQEASG